jgi:hypothetical protein
VLDVAAASAPEHAIKLLHFGFLSLQDTGASRREKDLEMP